jgi:ATP-binding cassette subfamily B protein
MLQRWASADGFISQLPKQYDESVGIEFQGGVELSKGQQQKVALARVFYKRAPLMILDEPTAAVDAISEDTIFKSIIERDYNQTIVLISHKFSNVRDADEIILIQNGTILEQGSHDTLMKRKKGKYKELFELQAEGYK